ncbi:MAG: TatD family hydrolase [Gammaproteobacteria bacterium]|nr:TatD family hydrolase [Gammaproteobacteria bacterium]
MALRLVDIGANLAHDSFDPDRATVLREAREAGVERIVITGSSVDSSLAAAKLAAEAPGFLYATAGMHPHHASDYDDAAHATFSNLASDGSVVAVGECGLDYFRNFSPREAQRDAFARQLDIAIETGLPVFLHERDAHDDYVEILKPRLAKISRAVAHCFTGTEQQLRTYIDMGLYIGITGWICDERRGSHLKEIVHLVPPDRLMLETDAPYLLPRSLRPKPKSRRNEPKYLPEVLHTVAEACGKSAESIAARTRQNACRFFGLGEDSG